MTDHRLHLDVPYEPDWWCLLQHGTSGHGPACPDC